MSRRSNHYHALRTKDGELNANRYQWGTTWCGERHAVHPSENVLKSGEDVLAWSRRMADCPKCAAAIGKTRLHQIADRVNVEAADIPTSSWGKKYRSLNRVWIDGVHVGWIVMQNGWGNPWTLHQLSSDDDRDYGPQISHTPATYSEPRSDNVFQRVHSASRDMMASAALRCFDLGQLPTRKQMAEQTEARRRKEAEQAEQRDIDRARAAEMERLAGIERERKDGLRAERKAVALDWLNAVLEMPDLTNSQRAGAQATHDIITGKDVI